MSKCQKFSPEFRSIAVEEVVGKNRRIVDVAEEMKVGPGTLGNWVNRHRKDNPEPEKPLSLSERAELAELRRENVELRQKADFLGKGVPRTREVALR